MHPLLICIYTGHIYHDEYFAHGTLYKYLEINLPIFSQVLEDKKKKILKKLK